ncbi:MAG: hypothetical protein P9L96_03540 [Candidatus Gygaella obscura]|nr:hypothetical protein [Candidatus Gygaella obscura]
MKKINIIHFLVFFLILGFLNSAMAAIDERQLLIYDCVSFRDPFEPTLPIDLMRPEKKKASQKITMREEKINPPTFSVQGVIWGGDIPLAIIDNSVVKIGDVMKDASIVDIKKEKIEFVYKGRYFEIPTTYATNEYIPKND